MKKTILTTAIAGILMSGAAYSGNFVMTIKDIDYTVFDATTSVSTIDVQNTTVTEKDGDFEFELPLSLGSEFNSNTTVDYVIEHISTDDTDIIIESGTATVGIDAVLPITIKGDNIYEEEEQFRVTLSNPEYADLENDVAIITITDNDSIPSISVNDVTVSEGETANIEIVLDRKSSKDVQVLYTVSSDTASSSDFTASSGLLTIKAGDSTGIISINTVDDLYDEEEEKFKITLSEPVLSTLLDSEGYITITDNDAAPLLSISDSSINETDEDTTELTFTVELSTASEKTVSVNFSTSDGTAIAGEDYVAVLDQVITFEPYETSKEVSVVINGDYTFEDHETLNIALSNAENADIEIGTAVGTITNNDVIYVFNTLPLYGIIQYDDGSGWVQVEEDTEYSREYSFRYNPTESDVLAVSNDINVGSFDTDLTTPYYADGNHSINDWGTVSGNTAIYKENGVTVTTKVTDGNLAFANKPGTATGVGLGTSLSSSNELYSGVDLEITLEGDFLNDVKIVADGLGGCYDLGNACETKVEITAYDFEGSLIDTQGGYRDATSSEYGQAYIDDYYFTGETAIQKFVIKVVPTNVGGNNSNLTSGANPILNMTISRSAFEVMDYTKIDVDGNSVTETLKLNINEGNANVNVDLSDELAQ